MIPKASLKPPRHSRIRFDEAELRHLSENMVAIGQINPIEALPSLEIISGHRRWLSAMSDDRITEVAVRIVADPITAKEIRIRRVSENVQRVDITALEWFEECQGLRDDEPGITAVAMADLLNVDPSTITRYMSIASCVEEVRQALRDDLIGIKAVYELSKEPPLRQQELLASALAGGAGEVTKARRRSNGNTPAARASKIRVVLTSGVTVTVGGGESLSLESAIAELSDALAEMRKAEKQGLDAKEFMSVCRRRAKASVA